jgi:hypothetical protein
VWMCAVLENCFKRKNGAVLFITKCVFVGLLEIPVSHS